jgi:hypothetical protein
VFGLKYKAKVIIIDSRERIKEDRMKEGFLVGSSPGVMSQSAGGAALLRA